MTFFLIGGIVFVILSVILIILFLITHNIDEHSLASKILMWIGMLSSVAGASFLTLEYSFPHVSHPERYEEREFIAYVNTCVVAQFAVEHGDDAEIIVLQTTHVNDYYISDVHYRIVYDNNIYLEEYISSVNDKDELVMKKVEVNKYER